MAQLAFWFGCDPVAMDRVFRRSGLMREKYETRADYRNATITNAISGCRKVYDMPQNTTVQIPLDAEPMLSTDDDDMTLMSKLLAKFAYCPTRSKNVVSIWTTETDTGMTFDSFKKLMFKFSFSDLSGSWLRDPHRVDVADLRMRPDRPFPLFSEGGQNFINTYRPPVHDATGGDATTGVEFLKHLLPDDRERHWFTQHLAHKFTHPAIPGPGVIMVAHNVFGTGRGTLARLIERLFGEKYVKSVPFADAIGSTYQSQHTEWQAESLWAVIDEASNPTGRDRYSNRAAAYEKIKELVDPAQRNKRFNRKGLGNFDGPMFTSFLIATNHLDALPIPPDDRRFAVLSNGARMSEEFKTVLNRWMNNPANVAAFAQHLSTFDLAGYSPYAEPIMTDAKAAMVDAGQSDVDRGIVAALDAMPGRTFTVHQIVSWINKIRFEHDWQLPDSFENIVRGAIKNHAFRIGEFKAQNWQPRVNGKRCAVYVRSRDEVKEWTARHDVGPEAEKNNILMIPLPHLQIVTS
jgi:hypothetical protein